jgi:serine/threonine protein phosphatase 1
MRRSVVANMKLALHFLRRLRSGPTIPAGLRVYAIGDIHGRLDLLEQLLVRIEEDVGQRSPADILVILLGDLIDRGPDSAGVVRRAMAPLEWGRLVTLKGNHEAAMLDALGGDSKMFSIWLRNGGREAVASWGLDLESNADLDADEVRTAVRAVIPAAQIGWLHRQAISLHIGDYFFVHAGVRPGVALDKLETRDALWIRDEFLTSDRSHGAIIVHGHTPRDEVEERPNRIGIDTGAYFSGRLTALGLEGDRRWFLQTAAS